METHGSGRQGSNNVYEVALTALIRESSTLMAKAVPQAKGWVRYSSVSGSSSSSWSRNWTLESLTEAQTHIVSGHVWETTQMMMLRPARRALLSHLCRRLCIHHHLVRMAPLLHMAWPFATVAVQTTVFKALVTTFKRIGERWKGEKVTKQHKRNVANYKMKNHDNWYLQTP